MKYDEKDCCGAELFRLLVAFPKQVSAEQDRKKANARCEETMRMLEKYTALHFREKCSVTSRPVGTSQGRPRAVHDASDHDQQPDEKGREQGEIPDAILAK